MTAATATELREPKHASARFGPNRARRRAARRVARGRCRRSRVPASTTDGYDSRPGVLFLNNRYHDPQLGVFISVDPLVTTTGEPYIYASGSPTTLSDPTGLCSMISGDLWCGSGNVSLAERCLFGGSSCSAPVARTSYLTIRHTSAGKAIGEVIDVAHQADWLKRDGNWSSDDVADAADGANLDELLANEADRAAVQRVAGALEGHDELWEEFDHESSWYDHISVSYGGCIVVCADFALSAGGFDANLGPTFGLVVRGTPTIGYSSRATTVGNRSETFAIVDPDPRMASAGSTGCVFVIAGACGAYQKGEYRSIAVGGGIGYSMGTQGDPYRSVSLPWFWGS